MPRCKNCKKLYFLSFPKQKRLFCSNTCTKEYHRQKRKMTKRDAWVENVVFEKVAIKYNYKCNNCGIETPGYFRNENKHNSPEVDHIIPLSKGGKHSYENVQLLCRRCNLKKSNK